MSTQDLPSLIDKLGAAALEAREAIREAHTARKDALTAMKQLNEARREAEHTIATLVGDEIHELVTEVVQRELGSMLEAVGNEQQRLYKDIQDGFVKLSDMLMAGDPAEYEGEADDLAVWIIERKQRQLERKAVIERMSKRT